MNITLDEFMKMLESGKQITTATRLIDGVVPRVDFVDAGANGEGENGFLVKKNRKGSQTMDGQLTYNEELQKWEIVQKSAEGETEPTPIKMSADAKAALGDVLSASKAKIEALEKAIGSAEDDAEATDIPEAIQTMVTDLAADFGTTDKAKGKIPPQFLQGKKPGKDEEEMEDDKAKGKDKDAAKVKDAKKSDPEPEGETAETEPEGFSVGDLAVSGPLADIAKAMAEAAGDKMQDPEFAGLFRESFAPMAKLQAALNPEDAANVAVAAVEKRMKTEIEGLKATIADQAKTIGDQTAKIDAMGAGFGGMPQVIREGAEADDVAPVKKTDKGVSLMAGQDISEAGIKFVE